MKVLRTIELVYLRLAPGAVVRTGLFLLACMMFALVSTPQASAETRKLKLYFLHTGEKAEITYKKNGRYVSSGLKKINRFLRDWRRNEPTKMDPRLLDLIWEVYRESGSRKHIHVVSGYRSPATNGLLRKRGRGVAKKSQHTLGKALDFFIPGVNLRKLRNIALKKGLGGVGYYPKSGSPFIHMDTGRVRHWPRMSRKELVKVFPKGKTLHVPTDGKPLARYNQAKAEYERKLKGGFSVASASEVEKKPGFFAKFLGRGEGDDEEIGAAAKPEAVIAALNTDRPNNRKQPTAERKITPVAKPDEPAAKVEPATQPVAAPKLAPADVPAAPTPSAAVPAPVPPEPVEPKPAEATPEPEVVTPEEEQTPETVIAALPANAIPVPQLSPRAEVVAPATLVADATPVEENSRSADVAAIDTDDDSLQLAYGVPVRAPRETVSNPLAAIAALEAGPTPRQTPAQTDVPETQVEEELAALTEEAPAITRTPTSRKDALTADEIADLREEVYASLKQELKRNQVDTTATLASTSRASTELNQGNSAWDQLQNLESSGSDIQLSNLPVPEPATRTAAQYDNKTAPVENVNEDGTVTVRIDEHRLGKWALEPSISLEQIRDIKAPDARNILRGKTSSVLTNGFVIQDDSQQPGVFTGNSLGSVNFKRFQ